MSNPFATSGSNVPATQGGFADAASGNGQMPALASKGGVAPMTDHAKRDAARADLVEEVNFDSDVGGGMLNRIPKFAKEEKQRWSFVLFDAKGMPRLKSVESFSFGWENNQRGISFLAPRNNTDLMSKCVQAFGDPRTHFGAILLRYHTDKLGNVGTTGGFDLEGFKFGLDKFKQLKSRHSEWPLSEHDLIVECQEEHYQKLDFNTARDCMWHAAGEEVKAQITANAEALFGKPGDSGPAPLDRLMGYYRSDEDILYLLTHGKFPGDQPSQGSAPAPATAGAAVNPFAATQQAAQPSLADQAGVGDAASASFADLAANKSGEAQPQPADEAGAALAEDLASDSPEGGSTFAESAAGASEGGS